MAGGAERAPGHRGAAHHGGGGDAANAADGAPLPDLVVERATPTGAAPAQVMGDTAYGSTAVQTAVMAVAPTTAVGAPVPPANDRAGHCPKTAFTLDPAAETITCPHGDTGAYGSSAPAAATGCG